MRRPLIVGGILAALAGLWLALRGGRRPIDVPDSYPAVQPPGLPAVDDRIAHNGIFAALGRATYRGRRWLPIVGLAIVIGLNVWGAAAGGRLSQGGWQVPGSEAAEAEALLADRYGEQATTMLVLFTDPDGDAASDAFQAQVAAAVAPVAADPIVSEVLTFADVGDSGFVSRDGSKTFALVRIDRELEAAIDDAEHLASLVAAPEGVETVVTGIPLIQHEFNEAVERDLVQAELVSLPIAMLILLAVFGTVVGAVLPIVIAGLALPSSMAAIGLLANVTEMSIFVTNVATMIGLALLDRLLPVHGQPVPGGASPSIGGRCRRAHHGHGGQGRGHQRGRGRHRPVQPHRVRVAGAAQHGHRRRGHRALDARLRPHRPARAARHARSAGEPRCASRCHGPCDWSRTIPRPPTRARAMASGPGSPGR